MAMCRAGATDYDLAHEFEVAPSTISLWQAKHEAFAEAVRIGKEAADARVERSLYQRAVGYTYEAEKVFNNLGMITRATVVEHVPPDVGACKLWLTNRRPDDWREKNEHDNKVRDLTPQRPDDERLMLLLKPFLGPSPYEVKLAAKAEKEVAPPKDNGAAEG
jgi:hypothetical protein